MPRRCSAAAMTRLNRHFSSISPRTRSWYPHSSFAAASVAESHALAELVHEDLHEQHDQTHQPPNQSIKHRSHSNKHHMLTVTLKIFLMMQSDL
jgi:hypothetical protein